MDDALWALFRDTGEPMSYLLLRAEEKLRRSKKPTAEDGREPSLPPDYPTATD